MKNLILIGLALLFVFTGYSYFSNSLKRSVFVSEADSLLRVARDLTPKSAPGLLVNKAEQQGILLREEDVRFETRRTDVSTQTSEKFKKSGLRALTYTATLAFSYTQTFMGMQRSFSYSKSRNYTRSVEISPSIPENFDPFEEGS